MSNTRKVREFQPGSGKLTRPRHKWSTRARGISRSPYAGQMQQTAAQLLGGIGRMMLPMARRGNADRKNG